MNEEPNSNNLENYDEDQNTNNQQVKKSYNPANLSKIKNLGNKAYRAAKKTGEAVKKAIKVIGNIAKSVVKIIASNPYLFAAIAIIAAFLIIVVLIINKFKEEKSSSAVSKGSNQVIASWNENNLTEQQKNAKSSYEKSGSLIDFSNENINSMIDILKEDLLDADTLTDEKDIYESLLKEVGSNPVSDQNRIVSPDDKISLYEHILNIAKYDFNNVKWKHYGHGHNGEASPLKDDYEMGVHYPSDQNNTKYSTFSSLLKPYLLSYEVPLAFFSGLIDDSDGVISDDIMFPYAIAKYGLSDVVVDRYDVQEYNLNTFYRDYDYQKYRSVFDVTITENSDGSYSVSFSGYDGREFVSNGHVNTRFNESTNQEDVMKEEVIPESTYTSVDNVYYVSKANLFDLKQMAEYRYVQYSESDANSRINPDTENYNPQPYNETINSENYVNGKPSDYSSNNTLEIIISGIESSYNATMSLTSSNLSSKTYHVTCAEYEERTGTTQYVTRTWSDTLSQTKKEESEYTVEDLIEYNNSLGNLSQDDFNADSASVQYYDELEDDERLNRIDFLNSNPNIYNLYVYGNSYEKYVGINREYLEDFCYNSLVSLWQNLIEEYETFPYVYGKTYGFGSSLNSYEPILSGIGLLKAYIHSFEGDGSYAGGGVFDENYTKVDADSEDAKYYKVYDASDGVHTVGYGVNMEAHASAFQEYEIDVSTVQYGDYIEKEIVDKIEDSIIKGFVDQVKTVTNGIELPEYQIHALASHCYLAGNISGFVDNYSMYWDEEIDDKYEELFEEYKETPEQTSAITSEIDFDNQLFTDWFSYYNGSHDGNGKYPGWVTRQKSEFTLFQGGYYTTLKVFWQPSMGLPINVNLVSGTGIDPEACEQLHRWYEDNVFSGKLTAASYDPYNSKSVKATNIKNTDSYGCVNEEYSKIATGSYFFQCPWWSRLRANMYLQLCGSEIKLTGATGDGKYAAETAWKSLRNYNPNIELNTNANNIRPFSIISLTSTTDPKCGHTAFVEAVSEDYIVLSECGSGTTWMGVTAYTRASIANRFVASVCLTDVL